MTLPEIIIQRIRNEGPIAFREYMEMALYYPGLGYYTSGRNKIGKQGDFYTSSTVSPAFGAMLARQIEEMYNLAGAGEFMIIEYGAGTGALCEHILQYLDQLPGNKIRYGIIEKSPSLRAIQHERLGRRVSWHHHISDLAPFVGCVLSNELIDNFSVHQVVMKQELMEVCVGHQDEFVEVLRPAGAEIKMYFDELRVNLPPGFRTEVCLDILPWYNDISQAMKQGYVFTIDYGYPSAELYSQTRSQGTLMAYYQHRLNHDLYTNIGRQDITAHVNFSALALFGHRHGFDFTGYRDQGPFLTALGLGEYLTNLRPAGEEYVKTVKHENFVLHTLIEDMGAKFKVLIQQKQMPSLQLKGFKTL